MDATAVSSCKLFIGGLSAQTTTQMLSGHFEKYGRITDAVVMNKGGKPRGFGFVTFEAPAAADAVLAEQQWLGDRFVDVKRAIPGQQPEVERAPNNKIFVGGLPQEAATEDLRACFARYGPIADAVVMLDRKTSRSRGFGFIRFAGGPQGTQAAEAVLRDAKAHRLMGKWIEVKRAEAATQLQELSPSSASTASPSSTPQHRQPQQQQLLHQHQQRFRGHPLTEVATPGLQPHPWMQQRGQRSPLSPPSPMSDPFGMYGAGYAHWSALAGAADGFGMGDWQMVPDMSPLSPMYSPLHRLPAGLSHEAAMLGTWPLSTRAAGATGAAVQRSLVFGADPADPVMAATPKGSACGGAASSASHTDSDDEENRPPAANRASTPPPARSAKLSPPPGLGIMASPMKIELPSKSYEGFAGLGGLPKFQPLLSTN